MAVVILYYTPVYYNSPTLALKFIYLFFKRYDCFVTRCEGSPDNQSFTNCIEENLGRDKNLSSEMK